MADALHPDGAESEIKDWVPSLLLMAEHGDIWQLFIAAVYYVFRQDFIASQPKFQGRWVRHRRDPINDGKEAGFWHCVSTGSTEDERIPDIRRCERIRWLRAVIENNSDTRVDVWENERSRDRRSLIWFNEEYLIVLSHRVRQRDNFQYFQLVTAYMTSEENRRASLRKERDSFYKSV